MIPITVCVIPWHVTVTQGNVELLIEHETMSKLYKNYVGVGQLKLPLISTSNRGPRRK